MVTRWQFGQIIGQEAILVIGDDDISGWNGENKAGIVCPARSEASTC